MSGPAPRHTERVRVTASRRGAPAARPRPMAAALVEQTQVGELYLQGLLRAQLRLAVRVLLRGTGAVLALVLLLAAVPGARELRVGPVPLAWLLLGVLVYPALVVAAWVYTRAAERTERRFADLLSGSSDR